MKKILLTGIISTASLLSANFSDSKKILLNKIYVDNQNTFYCNNPYEIKGFGLKKFGSIIENEKFYSPKNIDNKRSKYIEWEHVVPAYNFGRQMPCWKEGGRKACQKDSQFNLMEADMHNLVPLVKLMKKEAILNLDLMFQNQVNLEIVILKLIINIKEHIQKKILEVILQEFIFI